MSIRRAHSATVATAERAPTVRHMSVAPIPGLDALARELADELTGGAKPAVRGESSAVAAAIIRTVEANFAQEEAIDREAERTLANLPAAPGMDKGKLLAGIRDRLAKKRGFVL